MTGNVLKSSVDISAKKAHQNFRSEHWYWTYFRLKKTDGYSLVSKVFQDGLCAHTHWHKASKRCRSSSPFHLSPSWQSTEDRSRTSLMGRYLAFLCSCLHTLSTICFSNWLSITQRPKQSRTDQLLDIIHKND